MLDVSQIPSSITAHAPGYIDREQRDHRRPADRRAAQARDHAERRPPHGAQRAQGLRLRARSARRRDVHQVPQDPQRGGVRRLHRGHPAVPQLAHPHRPARRLRPRPDHRRLPARRALRRRPAHRAQAGGEARARRRHVDRRDHPRPRGAGRADPRAQGTAADGRELRVRHLRARAHRDERRCSGCTSATWPASRNRTARRCRSAGRRRSSTSTSQRDLAAGVAHRGAGAGDHRRLRHQAAHRPLPAHAGIRRAVRRRSRRG